MKESVYNGHMTSQHFWNLCNRKRHMNVPTDCNDGALNSNYDL